MKKGQANKLNCIADTFYISNFVESLELHNAQGHSSLTEISHSLKVTAVFVFIPNHILDCFERLVKLLRQLAVRKRPIIVFVNHNCIEQRGQTVLFVPIQPVNISARYLVYNKVAIFPFEPQV